jgi:hypothetical protein
MPKEWPAFMRERSKFCLMLCRKAKGYLSVGYAPDKIKDYIAVDFGFYGGRGIFLEEERQQVIDGAYDYAIEDYMMPE